MLYYFCFDSSIEIINIFWGQWSNWGECKHVGNSQYEQTRSRICSKPGKCTEGSATSKRKCAPSGIIWAQWTNCSCPQKVRHRYPIFIHNCGVGCPELTQPQYEHCNPTGCPTLIPTPQVITDGPSNPDNNTNNNNNNTKHENTTGTRPIVVIPITPAPAPITKCVCKDGYTFQLVELVSIGVGIIASCFVIVIAIVCLILRRDRKKNQYYPDTELKKSKSQPLLEECCDTMDSSSRESNA